MKKALGLIAFAVAALSGLSATAEAGHSSSSTYVSGYTSCGTPIYTQRILVGYDRYQRPIYQYRTLPPRSRQAPVYHGGGYQHYQPRYEPRYQPRYEPACDPRYAGGGYYPRARTEVVISGSGGYFGYRN
jgi:hypothetical protein